MKIFLWGGTFVLMASVCGVAGATPKHGTKPSGRKKVSVKATLSLDKESNGKTVKLAVGQHVTVRLGANLSTGYGWGVTGNKGKILKTLGAPLYVLAPNSPPGTPGFQQFEFVALKAGTEKLTFDYVRPWEKDKKPEQVFVVHLKVG